MYIKRHIKKAFERAKKGFPAVLVTGPRQVGKSTALKTILSGDYVTLDDIFAQKSIRKNGVEFLELKGTPLILDEVQKCPEIFESLKYVIDKNRTNGMYYLSGSQCYALMENVTESLAGRIGIINMLGLSNREIDGDSFDTPFLPTMEYLKTRKPKEITVNELWNRIHKGSLPEMYVNEELDWQMYYSAYVSSYIERDVRSLTQVGDVLTFVQFLTCLAARTGELLNVSSIASDVGISLQTAKKWISILQSSNIIYLLQPFSLNINKRIIKTPKVYFTDTGLVCYLCKWLTKESAEAGAMSGKLFETYVVNEIIKSYYNDGKEPPIYFFRNTDSQEVDLLFYMNNSIYPLEIKKTASPNEKDAKTFKVLETYFPTINILEGGVLCTYNSLLPLAENCKIIPISYI